MEYIKEGILYIIAGIVLINVGIFVIIMVGKLIEFWGDIFKL